MPIKALRNWTQKLRILYVEDEKDIREETTTFLKHLCDDIVVAENGEEGLACFTQGNFDLVITDLHMPKLGGEAIIDAIKTTNPEVIVIAMSGISGNNGREKLSCDFFIQKPASLEDFASVLSKIRDDGMITRVFP